MSGALDPTLRGLDDCGCCAGVSASTPAAVTNRDGLDVIAYRIGTHAQFKRSLLAALSDSQRRELLPLHTRSDDDFTIALLDGWATVADVLAFYQERYANESYLRTATERRSILELARAVGYELDPGVAASTWLAFTVEPSVEKVRIPKGVKVQSVPGQDEKPQTFESVEEIKEARPEWNALKPKLTKPQTLAPFDMPSLWIEGVNANLRTGDWLLIMAESAAGGFEAALRRIITVNPDARAGRTEFLLEKGIIRIATTYSKTGAWALRVKTAPFGHNVPLNVEVTMEPPDVDVTPVDPDLIVTPVASNVQVINHPPIVAKDIETPFNTDLFKLFATDANTHVVKVFHALDPGVIPIPTIVTVTPVTSTINITPVASNVQVIKHPPITKITPGEVITKRIEWPLEEPDSKRLTLDAVYEQIQTDSWIVVDRPDANTTSERQHVIAQAKQIQTLSRTDYGIAVRATQVVLDHAWLYLGDTLSTVRKMVVHAQSEPLTIAEQPTPTAIFGDSIVLDREIRGLIPGQLVIVSGTNQETRESANEVVALDHTDLEDRVTKLVFTTNLQNNYLRDSVTIYANVAAATHGESATEILGSGDASRAHQRFTLKHAPLTYTRANSSRGVESSLRVWVNDIMWTEVSSLFEREPDERVFITRQSDDGTVTVTFGDGRSGARLPTGTGNIRANYRKGTGVAGMVRTGQLKTLLSRPLGLRDAVNRLPALGADDPEKAEDARVNAPLTVRTLDRVVSLQDYEDFTRAYPGIAKALATWTWSGRVRGVLLTIALVAPKGGEAVLTPELKLRLHNSLHLAGDPFVPVRIAPYRPAFFELAGTLRVKPELDAEKVLAAAREALRREFGFATREFGQPVSLSGILATLHRVPGIEAVDLDHLQRTDRTEAEDPAPRLAADLPVGGVNSTVPAAELLMLDEGSLENLTVAP
jgi:predicted phage baseplate assembly protein